MADDARSSCSPRTRSRRTGSTSCPTSPAIRCRRCTRGTMAPAGPDDLAPIFPMALIVPGGQARARGRGPRGRARGLQAVAPDAAVPRAAPGGRARYARAHLLQVRGRLARRLAQAQHRGPAGLRERAGRHPQADDRDRRRPVGLVAGLRLPALRPGVRGLHGRLLLRPEALPALDDADVGRDGAPLALGRDRVRPRQRRLARPARWGSRSPRRSRSPPRTRTPTTRWARCSTTCCCTRPSSARSRSPRWSSPATSPTSSSAASAAARTSPAWPTRGCGASCAPASTARASSPPSRRRARR